MRRVEGSETETETETTELLEGKKENDKSDGVIDLLHANFYSKLKQVKLRF